MDASFQFGDVGVLLNLNPKNKSIADLVPELDAGDLESIDTFIIEHSSGVRVLLAPGSPEQAEHVTASHAKRVLERLRADHDLVVVDCPAAFNDTTLAILDEADLILTLLSRADSTLGIRVTDVENSIGRKVDHTIVSDGRSVVYALNRGVPFFLSNRDAQVSQDILRLATAVAGAKGPAGAVAHVTTGKAASKKSLFA